MSFTTDYDFGRIHHRKRWLVFAQNYFKSLTSDKVSEL